MATANNAVYTPTPKTLDVVVYRADDGTIHAATGPAYLAAMQGTVLRVEAAVVIGRGNLLANGRERWYQVQLADGTRHSVIGEGS